MFTVCPRCGEYSIEKIIDPTGPYAICPDCGYAHRFLRLPLFIISGASGAGKSTLCLELVSLLRECVVLESDILWGAVPATPDKNYHDYHNTWLHLCKNIAQSGRPVVLCGTIQPDQLERSPQRRYFSAIHYQALVSDDEILAQRLRQRPDWREANSPEFIERMQRFNRWLKEHAPHTQPPMTLYDTSDHSLAETTRATAQWIRSH
ncbi:MAG: AAA family ATPase, partial [Ktedonobacteraceae bacterium]|nr:AAA family ATPase [Ktedonobacteraceae bacterium]